MLVSKTANLKKIAVFVSGGGTNLGALIKAQEDGIIKSGKLSLVVSSKAGVFALERAQTAGIKHVVIESGSYPSAGDFTDALLEVLKCESIDLVVLAGYMSILDERFIKAFDHRIINVHPALIPSFCGKGFYGLRVHRAALSYGVKLSGATVHFVNEIPDGGEIILQKSVPVEPDDTPESLQQRIMSECEWVLLPKAVELFCSDKLVICDRTVKIID